tara:strand:- start:10541 stop:10927 length:387 start_codon:yes stop_codon:yes gene_type:complete
VADQDNDMNVSAPKFQWVWNLNTITVLIGFAAGFVAWGYTISEMQTGRAQNAANIVRLETRVGSLEASTRMIDNHELRIGVIEAQIRDTSDAMRSLETTLNSLAADLRVTREILERLERSQTASIDPQ